MGRLFALAALVAAAPCSGAAFASPASTSPRSCVHVWNDGAPSSFRERLRSDRPLYARISVITESRGVPLSRPQCLFRFVLNRGRTLSVSGPDDTVYGAWSQPLPGTLTLPVSRNATVQADGSVAFRG